ncbi:MAG: alanine--tRNA ligase [Actinomycetota bacterium]|nr:alanine--tRNA ligase [Actinomycetota bacterium]
MQSSEIRRRFLDFFERRDHRVYPSSSLIPYNDPTVLLTTAGMQQFITYFTGEEKPPSPRAVSAQKCFRTQDIEEVGDPSHLTFFEMMGNFSFGDYFKKEAVEYAWQFLTGELGLAPERLWVTIFEGDEDAPKDLEAKRLWMDVGVPEHRIFGLPKSENWWGPPGDSGPCGPCSEVYFDYGEEFGLGDPLEDPKYGPGGDEGDPRFLEIWNLVFNQYEQRTDGTLVPLAKTGIDTGMGLERTAAVVQGQRSVYGTDLYAPVFEKVREGSGISLGQTEALDRALHILADHARAIAFLVADGVRPGNQGREYVLRRIIRRATREVRIRVWPNSEREMSPVPFLAGLVTAVVDSMGDFYRELTESRAQIDEIVQREATRFIQIYESGKELLESELSRLEGGNFPGDVAFTLHDTYGFPVEVTREVLAERGVSLDEAGYEAAMDAQRSRARAAAQGYDRAVAAFGGEEIRSRFVGYERERVETRIVALEDSPEAPGEVSVVLAENPFYATGGGQVADEGWISSERGQLEVFDVVPAGGYQVLRARVERDGFAVGDAVTASINRVRRQQIEANHTATHILHWALRAELGQDVVQAGSYVGPDRLRFDYRHNGRVSEEQIRRVQEQCLLKITENQPVRYFTTTLEEASELGAMMLFGEKYGDLVRVVEVDGFSRELCGGTHVRGTAEVGAFKVISNRKHGADLYRIEVVTGREALFYLTETAERTEGLAASLRVPVEGLPEAVNALRREARQGREAARKEALEQGLGEVGALVEGAERVDGARVVTGQVVAADVKGLRQISDDVKNRLGGPSAVVLAADLDGKAVLIANLHPEVGGKVRAGDIVREVSEVLGGGGGGGATMAQAGGGNLEAIPDALARAREILGRTLSGTG